jgi:hypothetical protein
MINRTRSETFSWRTAVGQDICYYITYKRNWFSFIWSNQIIITSINSVVSSSVVSTQTQVRLNHVLKTRIVRSWHLHCCSPCITNKTIQYKFSQSENQNRSSKTELTWVHMQEGKYLTDRQWRWNTLQIDSGGAAGSPSLENIQSFSRIVKPPVTLWLSAAQ